MSAFYLAAAAKFTAALKKRGQVILLNRTDTGAYNIDTRTVEPGTPMSYPAYGFVDFYRQNDIDGSLIRQTDRRLYVSADIAVEPRSGDTISLADATVVQVVVSKPYSPAGTPVYHDVQVRG